MIRFLLFHAKVPFDDIRLSDSEFAAGKANGLYGQGLPIWIGYDGKKIGDLNTILRALGREHGYYGGLNQQNKEIDYVIDKSTNFVAPVVLNILKRNSISEADIKS